MRITVLPNASKNEVRGVKDNSLKVAIKAPPEKGKANEELIKFLSRELKVPKSFIKIISGEKSKRKEVFIRYLNPLPVEKLLDKFS